MMDESDRQLLTRYRRGDLKGLETLIERYRRPLFGFIMNMMQNPNEADEVYQEVWMRVIRKHAKYKHGNFCGWLVRIAHNVIIDKGRRRKPDVSFDEEREEGVSLAEMLPGKEPGAQARLAARDLGTKLAAVVKALPADQRAVFVMRVEGDLSFKEIARIQKVSINTALARMQYALKKLRLELSDDYEELQTKV